jgi:hypothetical protein
MSARLATHGVTGQQTGVASERNSAFSCHILSGHLPFLLAELFSRFNLGADNADRRSKRSFFLSSLETNRNLRQKIVKIQHTYSKYSEVLLKK